jgi:hypothetical protein
VKLHYCKIISLSVIPLLFETTNPQPTDPTKVSPPTTHPTVAPWTDTTNLLHWLDQNIYALETQNDNYQKTEESIKKELRRIIDMIVPIVIKPK